MRAALETGLNAGLVALGIPSDIPNFDQLVNMGVDYLAATVAAEAGIPEDLTREGIKKLAEAAKTAAESGGGSGPAGLDFLKLDGVLTVANAPDIRSSENPEGVHGAFLLTSASHSFASRGL